MNFLPDSREVHERWRALLVAHSVQGVQVHDARLAVGEVALQVVLPVDRFVRLFTEDGKIKSSLSTIV